MSDPVVIDKAAVQDLGDALRAHAGSLRAAAGGVDRDVGEVPHDRFGLAPLILRLDEAREAFEVRLASCLGGWGDEAIAQVFHAAQADDTVVPLPRSAR